MRAKRCRDGKRAQTSGQKKNRRKKNGNNFLVTINLVVFNRFYIKHAHNEANTKNQYCHRRFGR